MGMQISRGIHPEVSQEKYLWVGETGIRADHSGFSSAERERSRGGASDGRPCSHAVVDTTEVLGLRGAIRSFPVAGFIFPIAIRTMAKQWQSRRNLLCSLAVRWGIRINSPRVGRFDLVGGLELFRRKDGEARSPIFHQPHKAKIHVQLHVAVVERQAGIIRDQINLGALPARYIHGVL